MPAEVIRNDGPARYGWEVLSRHSWIKSVLASIRIEKENKKVLKASVNGYHFTVSDTGPGIAKEVMHRIYEPLFSTKTVGANKSKSVGTGLGLTIVKSIVDDLQGEIKVDHDPKLKGARFKIWLPLVI